MLSCRTLTDRATDYLERELGPWGRFQVRFHVFLCHDCRRYLHQIEATIGILRRLPKDPPAPEVENAVLEAFRKKKGASR